MPKLHAQVCSAAFLVILLALLAVTGCGIQHKPAALVATLSSVRWPATAGNPANDFVSESSTGEQVDSSRWRGHPILIHFWASWCQPCREESRLLDGVARTYRSTGFEILAVTNEKDRGEVARFVREKNLSFPILFDPDSAVFDQYRVIGIPTSFFVDASGVIRVVVPGPLTASELQLGLTKILKGSEAGEIADENK